MKKKYIKKMISIIVPIYNGKDYINRCVKSLLMQNYKNIEIILVDDGSVDSTLVQCRELEKQDSRIVVIHKKNEGVSAARNAALNYAHGEYITFCDIDDYVEKNIYTQMVYSMEASNCDIVICGRYNVTEGRREAVVYGVEKEWDNNEACRRCIFDSYVMGSVWNKLFTREVIENVRFDTSLEYCEDMLFLASVLKQKNIRVFYLNEPLYNYVQNSKSVTNSKSLLFDKNGELKYIVAMNKILNLYSDEPHISNLIKTRIFLFAYDMLKDKIKKSNQKKKLKKYLIQNEFSYLQCSEVVFNDKLKKIIKVPILLIQ